MFQVLLWLCHSLSKEKNRLLHWHIQHWMHCVTFRCFLAMCECDRKLLYISFAKWIIIVSVHMSVRCGVCESTFACNAQLYILCAVHLWKHSFIQYIIHNLINTLSLTHKHVHTFRLISNNLIWLMSSPIKLANLMCSTHTNSHPINNTLQKRMCLRNHH